MHELFTLEGGLMPEFLLIRISKGATSFCQLWMRRAVTPNVAKWPCKLNPRVCEPGMEWLSGKLCENYRTWTFILVWEGLPSIEDAKIENKQKLAMRAPKWPCMRVACQWERMRRSAWGVNAGMSDGGSRLGRREGESVVGRYGQWDVDLWNQK